MSAAVYTDLSKGKIHNRLIFVAAVTPMIYAVLTINFEESILSAAAGCAVVLVLFPLFAVGVLGGGDVKLCMILPLYMNMQDAIQCIAASFISAAVIGLIKLVRNDSLRERIKYFCSYAVSVGRTGKLKMYTQEMGDIEYRNAMASYRIHFAVPVLIAVIMKAVRIY